MRTRHASDFVDQIHAYDVLPRQYRYLNDANPQFATLLPHCRRHGRSICAYGGIRRYGFRISNDGWSINQSAFGDWCYRHDDCIRNLPYFACCADSRHSNVCRCIDSQSGDACGGIVGHCGDRTCCGSVAWYISHPRSFGGIPLDGLAKGESWFF